MKKKLSIIIPCYKVEQYLNKCVESIVRNKSAEIEIILVDDGSPDNIPHMCDSWAETDTRIKVIHQENCGLSVARNTGFEASNGTYTWFVDSDDWLTNNAVDTVLSLIDSFPEIDVFITPLLWASDDPRKNWIDIMVGKNTTMSGIEYLEKFPNGATPRNIMKSSLLKSSGIRFAPKILHEDGLFGIELYHIADKVLVLSKYLYNYRQRSGSIMHTITIKNAYSHISMHKLLMDFMVKNITIEKQNDFKLRYLSFFRSSIGIVWHLRNTDDFKLFVKNTMDYRISQYEECAGQENYFGKKILLAEAYNPILWHYIMHCKEIAMHRIKYSTKNILVKIGIFDILYDIVKGKKVI